MAIVLDGNLGITTPSETNTGTLSVTGVTTLTGGLNAALPVLSGGTGVTTSTGTGAGVHATSPTLVTPILGTPTSGVLSSCTGTNLAKAWCNFSGTTTINSSFNVSSVSTVSTGVNRINFTTAMTDALYSVSACAGYRNASNRYAFIYLDATASTTTYAQMTSFEWNTAGVYFYNYDPSAASMSVFR